MSAANLACPLCGAYGAKKFLSGRDYNWQIPGVFTFFRCLNCGIVFQDLRLLTEPLKKYYPRFYGTKTMVRSEDIELRINNQANQTRLQILKPFCQSGIIFDVGCGRGFFLKFMKNRGWRVAGIDAAAEHVDFARDRLGLDRVSNGAWPQAADVDHKVNVVSFNHLVEHLRHPVKALAVAKSVLLPGGMVLVETPNIQSWPAKFFRSRWVTLDAPRHVILFSRTSLRRMLQAAGFEILSLTTYSPTTLEYSESIRYMLRDLKLYPQAKAAGEGPNESTRPDSGFQGSSSNSPKATKQTLHRWESKLYQIINMAADRLGCGCNLLAVARPVRTPRRECVHKRWLECLS